jgi:hypothetical protein
VCGHSAMLRWADEAGRGAVQAEVLSARELMFSLHHAANTQHCCARQGQVAYLMWHCCVVCDASRPLLPLLITF